MVERLRAMPGGESIPVTIGDMAGVPASGPFRLVYLVFNTLFSLLSQARPTVCFRNVAQDAAHRGSREDGRCARAGAQPSPAGG